MGSGGDEIGVPDWAWMQSGRNQSGNMRDVAHHHCAIFFRDPADTFEFERPWVGAGSDDDEFRFVLPRKRCERRSQPVVS